MLVTTSWPCLAAFSVACGLSAALLGRLAAQELPYGAPVVRIVHCSDVRCSTDEDSMGDAPLIQLDARYPEHAGAVLRVVVVAEQDKRTALIDLTADVEPDGRFNVQLPVYELPRGVYDFGVMGSAGFVAEGRFHIDRAIRRRRR